MKPRQVLVVLVALLNFLWPVAFLYGEDSEAITKAVLSVDNERADAQMRGDFAALAELLGDDLTYIHASGLVQNKADFIADLKSGKRSYTSIKSSELNVRVLQGSAIITGNSEISVTHEGKENKLSLRITEVYAQRNGHWQLIAYQSTRVTP